LGDYYLDAANEHRYDGHELLNLRWQQSVGRRWLVTLRINNLANTHYAERADFAFGNYRYFPGRDRSVFLEVGFDGS
jgi:outer membrane receptor protein involved in Fe transport